MRRNRAVGSVVNIMVGAYKTTKRPIPKKIPHKKGVFQFNTRIGGFFFFPPPFLWVLPEGVWSSSSSSSSLSLAFSRLYQEHGFSIVFTLNYHTLQLTFGCVIAYPDNLRVHISLLRSWASAIFQRNQQFTLAD